MSDKHPSSKSTDQKPINTTGLGEAPWYVPKRPSDPVKTSQVHVMAHGSVPRMFRVCYKKGPEGSCVAVRANTTGGFNVATNVYVGACTDIEGTDIEITNNNDEPASGTYFLIG